MKIRVITMSMGNTSDGFSNQDELDAALSTPNVVSVERQFFQQGDAARFAFVITYGDGELGYRRRGSAVAAKKKKKVYPSDSELEAALPEDRRPIYAVLRENRNATAKAQKKEGWMLANNYQLAHIACRAPQTKDALRKIHELGEQYCNLCGDFALDQVKGRDAVELNAPEGAWWSEANCYKAEEEISESSVGSRDSVPIPSAGYGEPTAKTGEEAVLPGMEMSQTKKSAGKSKVAAK